MWDRMVARSVELGLYTPPEGMTADDMIAATKWTRDEWRLETPAEVEARIAARKQNEGEKP